MSEKPPSSSKFKIKLQLDHVLLVIFVALLAVGLYGISSSKFQMKWLSLDTSGLEVIAQSFESSGEVKRKLRKDSLWFELSPGADIFHADSLQTGKNSHLVLYFDKEGKNKVTLAADTLVRVLLVDGKPFIFLKAGELSAEVEAGKSISIKSGTEVHEIEAKKDKAVQVQASQGEVKSSEPKTEEPQSQQEAPTPTPAVTPAPQKNRALVFPYPGKAALLLHMGSGDIKIAPKETCESECELKVSASGKEISRQSFAKSGHPTVQIKVEQIRSGKIEWSLKDGSTTETGFFELYPFSKSVFSEALKSGRAVEIMEP